MDDTCKHLSKVHLLMAERQRDDTTLPLDLWKRSISPHPHIQTLSCHLVTFSLLSLLPITPSTPTVTVPSHTPPPLSLFHHTLHPHCHCSITPSTPTVTVPSHSSTPTITVPSHSSSTLTLLPSHPPSPSYPQSLFLPITPSIPLLPTGTFMHHTLPTPSSPLSLYLPITPHSLNNCYKTLSCPSSSTLYNPYMAVILIVITLAFMCTAKVFCTIHVEHSVPYCHVPTLWRIFC